MKKINKYDISLIVIIIVVSLASIYFNAKSIVYTKGNEAYVYSNNELIGKYVTDTSNDFTVSTDDGYNRIKIEDNKVWIEETNCPDKYCQNQGKINGVGQVIVCLPNKLLIKIVGNTREQDIDIIAH